MIAKKLWPVLAVALAFGVVGCDDDETTTAPTVPVDQAATVQAALNVYLEGTDGPVVQAQDVFDNINDGDATNDYFILSVRSATHFALGHIPGATNIPWREIADPANLALLPTDQPIAVYCYTGHTGGVATTVLRSLGYEAYNMKWGIMSWTQDATVRAISPFVEGTDSHTFATETTNNAPGTFARATVDNTTSQDLDTIVREAAAAYVEDTAVAPTLSAQALFDNINDGDATNDYYVVSVRASDAYGLGHIPGAINIPWRTIADGTNLTKLPPDQPIAIYCYTGHTGGVATTALRMLGYEAVNVKFGITAWTQDATVRATSAFDEATHANNFTLEP